MNMSLLKLRILVCLIQASGISGEVLVIKNPSERILECISEDDGNAMVWNGDWVSTDPSMKEEGKRFHNLMD